MGKIRILTRSDDLYDTDEAAQFDSKSVLSHRSVSGIDGSNDTKISEIDTSTLQRNLNALVGHLEGVIGGINTSPECTLK